MSYRYVSEPDPISVPAGHDFSPFVSGATAHGVIFVPGCVSDVGEKIRLRILLPGEVVIKANGRVISVRKHAAPGCDVFWHADKSSSVAAVRSWQEARRQSAP